MLGTWMFIASILASASSLDNGLALTPPMGWLSWFTFRCNVNCDKYPDKCLSEQLFRRIADEMVDAGYAKVGYEYVIIDDCWSSKERDQNGSLQPHPVRFPNGMKALSDYIHSKGLKFGIYGDAGSKTCQGYPGSVNHLEQDAQTFASWGVDYVKIDGCHQTKPYSEVYPSFGYYLNKTGRPITYSCSWPYYIGNANYSKVEETCNLWRYGTDIENSWHSLHGIIKATVNRQDKIAKHAGRGHWNDPDMVIVGGSALNYDQSKVQMALWAILAAPLLLSADLRHVKPEYKSILQNRAIIAVNQDPLGIQGRMVMKNGDIQIWIRPISPVLNGEYSFAVAVVNFGKKRLRADIFPEKLNLLHSKGYVVEDLYDSQDCLKAMLIKPNHTITVEVNPTGVVFFRFTISSLSACQPMKIHDNDYGFYNY